MRRRRLATAAALGLAGVGLRVAGARRRPAAPEPQAPVAPAAVPPAAVVRRRPPSAAPPQRPPSAATPRPAPATLATPARAADALLLPRPAPFPATRPLPARAADVLLLPAPARARPLVTGPRLAAFAAVAVLALTALAVAGPRGGGAGSTTGTTAPAATAAPAAATTAPAPPVLATPAAVALRPFPAHYCRFAMPASGWRVIWADLQQGETIHSEAGGPDDARIACDTSAAGPPLDAARRAAADARLRAGYRGIALVASDASALLVYEYDEAGLGRVRVEAHFLPDGASLTATAPVARFAALAPVLEAVLASHGGAAP